VRLLLSVTLISVLAACSPSLTARVPTDTPTPWIIYVTATPAGDGVAGLAHPAIPFGGTMLPTQVEPTLDLARLIVSPTPEPELPSGLLPETLTPKPQNPK